MWYSLGIPLQGLDRIQQRSIQQPEWRSQTVPAVLCAILRGHFCPVCQCKSCGGITPVVQILAKIQQLANVLNGVGLPVPIDVDAIQAEITGLLAQLDSLLNLLTQQQASIRGGASNVKKLTTNGKVRYPPQYSAALLIALWYDAQYCKALLGFSRKGNPGGAIAFPGSKPVSLHVPSLLLLLCRPKQQHSPFLPPLFRMHLTHEAHTALVHVLTVTCFSLCYTG